MKLPPQCTSLRRAIHARGFAAIGLAAAMAAGCGDSTVSDPEANAAKPPQVPPIAITTATARTQPVERTIRMVGTLYADAEAQVATQVDGRLLSIDADLGDEVEAGQVLATIEPSMLEARLHEAEAVLQRAQSEANRADRLRKKGVMSPQDYDQAQSELSVARARREVLAIQLEHTRIRAPFAGRIAKRLVDAGNYVRTGTGLFQLVSDRSMKLRGEIPERFAGELEIGAEIRGSVAAFSDAVVRGRITRLSPAADPETRAITIEAQVDNADGRLRAGFFCKGEILVRRDDSATVVSADAVVRFAGVTRVFVIDGESRARPRSVRLGMRIDDVFEIEDGLRPGETVATSSLARLIDGASVAPRKPAASSETAS